MSHLRVVEGEGVDLATVDQQIEAIAVDIELTEQIASARIGQRLKEARDLFGYKRNGEGYGAWVEERLGYNLRTAQLYVQRFETLGGKYEKLFALSGAAQTAVVTATVDVQAIIAERVEAGELLTAAQVKSIKDEREKLKQQLADGDRKRVEEIDRLVSEHKKEIVAKEQDLRDLQSGRKDDLLKADLIKPLEDVITDLRTRLTVAENDPLLAELRAQTSAAIAASGAPAKQSRANPHYQPKEAYDALQKIAGPAAQIAAKSKTAKIELILTGFHDDGHRDRVLDEMRQARDFLTKIIGQANDQ